MSTFFIEFLIIILVKSNSFKIVGTMPSIMLCLTNPILFVDMMMFSLKNLDNSILLLMISSLIFRSFRLSSRLLKYLYTPNLCYYGYTF